MIRFTVWFGSLVEHKSCQGDQRKLRSRQEFTGNWDGFLIFSTTENAIKLLFEGWKHKFLLSYNFFQSFYILMDRNDWTDNSGFKLNWRAVLSFADLKSALPGIVTFPPSCCCFETQLWTVLMFELLIRMYFQKGIWNGNNKYKKKMFWGGLPKYILHMGNNA